MLKTIPPTNQDIILTQDGSTSIYSNHFKDCYHSRFGAIQESLFVFIDHGLRYRMKLSKNISILEVGLGTGLNLWLSYMYAQDSNIKYTALEPEPLSEDIVAQLNYAHHTEQEDGHRIFEMIHHSSWEIFIRLRDGFIYKKINTKIEDYISEDTYDLIYFDAFSPSAQPEMWHDSIFQKMYAMCSPGGALVTYCSKGSVRRSMQQAGFIIEKLPGPMGKRHITRATKP